jgi:HipA-like protein
LAGRLGIEQLVDDAVDLGDRAGAANPGRKVMSLVSAMALGADCIEDRDVLRSGQTGAVLGHVVAAPSTLGTFLRAFTFGHVRQLDRVLDQSIARALAAGAGPGDDRLVIDADSFVGEVHGYAKQGVGFGYTHKRGYHPILATRGHRRGAAHPPASRLSEHLARSAPASPIRGRRLRELFARNAFNILTGNTDDHARNHAQLETIETQWADGCDQAALTEVDRATFWRRQILNPYATEGYRACGRRSRNTRPASGITDHRPTKYHYPSANTSP